jgi:hypothetical protein
MLLIGIGLIVVAVIVFTMAKPRDGVSKWAGRPLLENIVALGITIIAAVGIVVTFIGLGSL